MRVNGSTAYSTVIASVNNRNAIPVAAPSQSPLDGNQKKPNETIRSSPQKLQPSLSATVGKSGRTATLSPHVLDKNLPPQTRTALNSYVNIQNQLHSDGQTLNQQLLGIDLFA
jgi:hypothetical protein